MNLRSFIFPLAALVLTSGSLFAQSANVSGTTLNVYCSDSSENVWVYFNTARTAINVQIRLVTSNSLLLMQSFSSSNLQEVRIVGNGGHDNIYQNTFLRSRVFGGAGNDRIFTNVAYDVVYGGPGADYISTSSDNDIVYGGDGVTGAEDSGDTIRGGPGDDYLVGEDGADDIDGEGGDDTIIGGFTGPQGEDGDRDTMVGGPGFDVFRFEKTDEQVGVHLRNGGNGQLNVNDKWWQGFGFWTYGPYDNPPANDSRGMWSPVREWQCAG